MSPVLSGFLMLTCFNANDYHLNIDGQIKLDLNPTQSKGQRTRELTEKTKMEYKTHVNKLYDV